MKTKNIRLNLFLAAAFLMPVTVVLSQKAKTDEPVRGPFFSGTIRAPKPNSDAIAMKGIIVTVGTEKNAFICFDADLLRVSMAWTGEFLEFGDTLNKIAWPPPPQVKGAPAFGIKAGPGWGKDGAIDDPRSNRQGILPKDWAHYKGLYQHGDHVVLNYSVGNADVLELPGHVSVNGKAAFTRTIQFTKPSGAQTLVLMDGVDAKFPKTDFSSNPKPVIVLLANGKSVSIRGTSLPAKNSLEVTADGRLLLKLGSVAANKPFQIAFMALNEPADWAAIPETKLTDLRAFTKGGAAHWTETVVTRGTLGGNEEAYAVDIINEPATNPYNAKTFFGGFDFFSDGNAAICTFHGDVWLVSGIDGPLEKVTWRRFATGLFQPLGLKIVKDTVYVLGRDQITRLHDLNKDGEADHFENFNNDTIVTANYHEFSMDLHTDTEGNFYFAKGSPWEPEVISPHQGCLFKVSKDGSRAEVFATGLRAPNGMTVGPRNEITVSDNQGHWMPSSKLNWIKKGGFYGMTPAAQRPLVFQRGGTNFTANPSDPKDRAAFAFKSWGNATVPLPTSYDKPMAWLPMNMDNSSGGQLWVTSKKWGPLNDQLLFMSYGKCTLFAVMPENQNGDFQGAMIQLPIRFNSGVMRGRVHPNDGQVYLSGLKGWQTSAVKDGGFYRVRYTGQPIQLPVAFKSQRDGIQLTFNSKLDAKAVADTANYSIESWNYQWTGAYGSAEFSANDSNQRKHDKLEVKSAVLLSDGRTVAMQISELRPADQLKISYTLNTAEGKPIKQDVYATIHQLGTVQK